MTMEREHDTAELVELGTASTDTQGSPIPTVAEDQGYLPVGLSDA